MTEKQQPYSEFDFCEEVPEFSSSNLRVRALKLMWDECRVPNRDLRLSAQVLECREELDAVLAWLQAEIAKEIQLETMFEE